MFFKKILFWIGLFVFTGLGYSNADSIIQQPSNCSMFYTQNFYYNTKKNRCACKDWYLPYKKPNVQKQDCILADDYCKQVYENSTYDEEGSSCVCKDFYTLKGSTCQAVWYKKLDDISIYNNIPWYFGNYDEYYVTSGINLSWTNLSWYILSCINPKQHMTFYQTGDNGVMFDCDDDKRNPTIKMDKFLNKKFSAWWQIIFSWHFIGKNAVMTISVDNKEFNFRSYKIEELSWDYFNISITVPTKWVLSDGSMVYLDESINKIKLNIYPEAITWNRFDSVNYEFNMYVDPKDPAFTNQFYIPNQNINTVWNNYKNLKTVVVAVIDQWIWFADNKDLSNMIRTNTWEVEGDNIDNDANGYIDDYYWWNFVDNNNETYVKWSHGTNVAWIIAAEHDNDFGIKGIAPNAKIMNLIACDSDEECDDEDITNAMKYAIDNWAQIINLSIWWAEFSYTKKYDEVVNLARQKWVIIVVAAGNWSSVFKKGINTSKYKVSPVCNDVESPWDIIGVWGLDNAWVPAEWSNYGDYVDFWSYGVNIFTSSLDWYSQVDEEFWTSFAAPQISAIIALGLWLKGNLTAEQIYNALKQAETNKIIDAMKFMKYIDKLDTKSETNSIQAAGTNSYSGSISNNTLNNDYLDNFKDYYDYSFGGSSSQKSMIDSALSNFFSKLEKQWYNYKEQKILNLIKKISKIMENTNDEKMKNILFYIWKRSYLEIFDE